MTLARWSGRSSWRSRDMPLGQMTASREMREAAAFVHWLRRPGGYRVRGPVNDDEYGSPELRESWRRSETRDADAFKRIVERISGRTVAWCDDCLEPVWSNPGYSWYGETGEGSSVCRRCLADSYVYCDQCNGYYYSDSHESEHGSHCEAEHQSFTFPLADGSTLASDTRMDVETAAGLISETGIMDVLTLLYYQCGDSFYHSAREWLLGNDTSHEWQTKDGNFTKRLAKFALQNGYKLPPPLISEIGNVARANCGSGKTHHLELTRDLNLPASEFVHGSSCWWGSEWKSRCALKQAGGFGIRTFTDGETVMVPECGSAYCNQCPKVERRMPGGVRGRAWCMPLDVERQGGAYYVSLYSDPMTAGAFVVFNAYGPDGYEFARMVAQMRGWTYRKVSFRCDPMYVNSGGWLVAPAEVCAKLESLSLDVDLECGCS